MRVLVTDDNWDAAETLALLLRLRGHEVRTAHDGLTALKVARAFQPQLALLDIQMPGLNGVDVARLLRRLPGLPRLSIVAVSATEPDDSRLAPYGGVFDAHLVKPCDMDALEAILEGCAAEGSRSAVSAGIFPA